MAILFPISFKSADNLAEATTGTAQDSTLTFSFINNRSTASVSLNVVDSNGTFATSADGTGNTVDERAAFSLTTNNATGYRVTIRTSGTNYTLGDTIGIISGTKTANNFELNKWGLLPSKYNSNNNTTNYYPISNTGFTIDETSTANTTANTYTIGLGIKADYTIPAGTYNNTTLVVEYVANPVNYTITYDKNTEDTVTNMPYSNNNYQQAGDTSATSITLSNLVPERDGYNFKGWCNGTVTTTNNEDSCTGTVYNPDGGGANLTYGIDKTTINIVTIKAMWKLAKIYMQDMTLSDCMVNVGTNGNSANIGDNVTVYDKRASNYGSGDDASYTVRYINGQCWMTQNLRVTGTLAAADSNFTGSDVNISVGDLTAGDSHTEARTHIGVDGNGSPTAWYNYCAASAGTVCTNSSTVTATSDVCPAGWHQPTSNEFSSILSYGDSFNLVSGGYYANSALTGTTTGFWWSATGYSASSQYKLGYRNPGVDLTGSNKNRGFYIRCAKNTPKITVTFAGSGVSSVKVCKTSGNCSGDDLLGTVSASGGSVSGLEYGSTYYLYPTFSTGYEFVSWAKTSSTGTLSSTSVANPTFTLGDGDGAVTITGKVSGYPLTINFGTGIYGVMVKSGSLTGNSMGLVTTNGGTVNLTSTSTKYYLIPLYKSKYTFNSWTASGGTVTSDTGNYGYYYYTAKSGVTNTATISAKTLGTTSSTTMQNLAAASCTHAPSAVKDSRDNEVYYIQRLADGKCWMLENLRLASGTLTSSNSNVSSSFTLPASGTTCFAATANCDSSGDSTHTGYTVAAINTSYKTTTKTGYGPGRNYVGVYYNYCAASAGTICASNSSDASYDVCPAGWKMPVGNSSNSASYYFLYNTGYKANREAFRYALSTPLSGRFYDGSASDQGTYGSFWSSTRYSIDTSMYHLYVSSSAVSPTNSSNRCLGFSVRCILK